MEGVDDRRRDRVADADAGCGEAVLDLAAEGEEALAQRLVAADLGKRLGEAFGVLFAHGCKSIPLVAFQRRKMSSRTFRFGGLKTSPPPFSKT